MAALCSAQARAADPMDTVVTRGAHAFVCTGIGAEARNNPEWKKYPLKVTATNVDGEYLGDIRVTIFDAAGAALLEAHCLAPWLLVQLPPGKYKAKVVAEGKHERTIDVTVRKEGQSQAVARFPEVTDT
jgi:hypothetical protein